MIGSSKVVEPVCDQPDMFVAPAKADSSVNGSKEVTVWLRLSALTGMFRTARWSAMKKASNLPARAFGQLLIWGKLKWRPARRRDSATRRCEC